MTTVVNVKELSKTNPLWKSDSSYVYIGRPSEFGNPIIKGQRCPVCAKIHQTGGSTLQCYEAVFRGRVLSDEIFKRHVLALKDKILVCYCVPDPCHGQIMAAYIDKETK